MTNPSGGPLCDVVPSHRRPEAPWQNVGVSKQSPSLRSLIGGQLPSRLIRLRWSRIREARGRQRFRRPNPGFAVFTTLLFVTLAAAACGRVEHVQAGSRRDSAGSSHPATAPSTAPNTQQTAPPLVPSGTRPAGPPASVGPTPQTPTNNGSSTTIANARGVVVGKLSAADVASITAAFNAWEALPSTCQGVMEPGTGRLAIITATGVSWAIATFEPMSGCVENLKPAGPGQAPRTVPIAQIAPWGGTPPIGVFEADASGGWSMNDEGGMPFPCPALGGAAPGPGNGSLPPAVLQAWGMSYAANCAEVYFPPQPQGRP